MVQIEKASRIEAPADAVWRLFYTEDGQRVLCKGFVREIEFDGIGLGSVRTMHLEGQWGNATIRERVEQLDVEDRVVHYRIIDTGGVVPFADYIGMVRVIPAGPDACVLMLRSTYVAVDVADEAAYAMSASNYQFVFDNVRRLTSSAA